MNSGILLIDKKSGVSSGKCVYEARKKLATKKIGHAGTLDPLATGLLPLLINKATRVSDFLMSEVKIYETLAFFGKKTDTQDKTGKVIDQSSMTFSIEDLKKTINEKFIGDILQTPPMYSALKYKGEKLYDLARKGQSIERKKRKIKVYNFEILDFNFPLIRFRITCSKGTYIRTLVNDLGENLNTFAMVEELRRLRVGDFDIKDAISYEDLENLDKSLLLKKIIPIDYALDSMEKFVLDKSYLKQAINGMTMKVGNKKISEDKNLRVYVGDIFIGIGYIRGNYLKLKRVFYEREY